MDSDRDPLFVDTWGWLALEDRKDSGHAAVLELRLRSVPTGPIWVTTDYVLDETITLLFSRRPFREAARFCDGLFRASREGALLIENINERRFADAYKLRLRYRDKPRISFTDLTSFVVMKEKRLRRVLTADAHFQQAGFETVPRRELS